MKVGLKTRDSGDIAAAYLDRIRPSKEASTMRTVRGLVTAALILMMSTIGASPGDAAPDGQMTWAVHISDVVGGDGPGEALEGQAVAGLGSVLTSTDGG